MSCFIGYGYIYGMTPVSPIRFNAIAGYARQPEAALFGQELAYFEVDGGRIMGMLMRDIEDGDCFGVVFAPNRKLRFRSVRMTDVVEEPAIAELDLAVAINIAAKAAEPRFRQADH